VSALALVLAFLCGVNGGLWLQRRFGAPKLVIEQVIVTTPDAYSEALSGAIRKVCEGMKLVGDDPHWLISHTVEMQAEGRPSLWLIVRNREHVQ
jgi:hypothetical protein